MKRINIDDEDYTQFESIKAEVQYYLGYDVEKKEAIQEHKSVGVYIDTKSVKEMTDGEFIALLVELFEHTTFADFYEKVSCSESFWYFTMKTH